MRKQVLISMFLVALLLGASYVVAGPFMPIMGGGGLPTQTGNAGKVLTTDGTTASWGAATGSETDPVFLVALDDNASRAQASVGLTTKVFSTRAIMAWIRSWFAPLASPVFTGTVTAPIIKPPADSTTAIRFTKADGVTDVATVDTTNARVGIGTTSAPTQQLHLFNITNLFGLFESSGGAPVGLKMTSSLGTFQIGKERTIPTGFWASGGLAGAGSVLTVENDPLLLGTNSIPRLYIIGDNIGFNQSTFGTNAAKVLAIGSGTAPTTSPADAAQVWVQDVGGPTGVAGSATLHLRDEPGNIGHVLTDADIGVYGLVWDESADTYTRTGMLTGVAVGSKPAESLLPIQSQMRRCVMSDAGVVQYYLCATTATLKENCVDASDLTGADGQVVVEIPAFYEKYSYAGTKHHWSISLMPLNGYSLDAAFIKDNVRVPFRYVGAYEGVLYDVSAGAYTEGNSTQVKDWTATTGDKLSSVSGKLAVTNGTRAQFRTIAANRGTGWRQLDYDLHSAIQLLYLIEYASFYSQSMIGAGISNVTDWAAYNNYYPIAKSGNSNAIGNASGNNAGSASCATESTKYMSYRGIEQWYGHIWKFVDGINVNSNVPYVSNTRASFADDTATGYTSLGVTLSNADGWQSTLAQISRGFLPLTVGSSSSTKITDYYWQSTGWRVVLAGGAYNGAYDGAFSLHAYYGSGDATSIIGGRLSY